MTKTQEKNLLKQISSVVAKEYNHQFRLLHQKFTQYHDKYLQHYEEYRARWDLIIGVEQYLRNIPFTNAKVCVLCFTKIVCAADNEFLEECEENASLFSKGFKVQVLPICISCQRKYVNGLLTIEFLSNFLEVRGLFSLLVFLYYITLIDQKKGRLCPYLVNKFNLSSIGPFKMKWCPKYNKKAKCKLYKMTRWICDAKY
jgi:hypothetical protein